MFIPRPATHSEATDFVEIFNANEVTMTKTVATMEHPNIAEDLGTNYAIGTSQLGK